MDLVGLVTYRGGILARRRSPIPVLTGLNVEQLQKFASWTSDNYSVWSSSSGSKFVMYDCVVGVVAGGEPVHHCLVPAGETVESMIPREHHGLKSSSSVDKRSWRYSQCERYVNSTISNATMPCDAGWNYDQSEFHSSIVSDVSDESLQHIILRVVEWLVLF